jgi:hypothetical protein
VKSQTKSWLKRLAIVTLAAAAVYWFHPLFGGALRAGVGLVTAAVYLAAYLFAIVALPLGFLWLFTFVYSLFLKPYLRAWHISRIRNARHLREAVQRNRSGE